MKKLNSDSTSSSVSTITVPLFPLNTVLFPQGMLPLRIFEIKYLDMVRHCLQCNLPFGVVNIVSGDDEPDGVDEYGYALKDNKDNKDNQDNKDKTPLIDINNKHKHNRHNSFETFEDQYNKQTHAVIGTLATIVDFDMVDPTILMVAVQGGQRFKVLSTHTHADGLLTATVELLPLIPINQVKERYEPCVDLLKRIVYELEEQHTEAEKTGHRTFCFPIQKPYQFNDMNWLANRFSEIMPISRKHKQMLLELNDADERLSWIYNFLKAKDIL